MKRQILSLFFFLIFLNVNGQTNISGFISTNTTWTVANSPYIVTGNALVSQGYTLIIEAGVTVKFNTNTALQVDGQLIAIGSSQNPITFTSNQPSPKAGDWGKLHIADNSVNAVYDNNGNYLSGTILKYCHILYGGGVGFGAVHIESASPYISRCDIQHSSSGGSYCVGSTYILDSSLVNDCKAFGLYFDQYSQYSCGLLIQGDTITNCVGGLFLGECSNGCKKIIKNNYFISNAVKSAIYNSLGVSNITISNNFFINNDVGYGYDNGVLDFYTINEDTISCNLFLNNQTGNSGNGMIRTSDVSSGIIINNIFDGNINRDNYNYDVSVIRVNFCNPLKILEFSNNIVRNNVCVSGKCCYFNAAMVNQQMLRIHHNEFINNNSKSVLYLDGSLTNNSNLDFLYLKFNNFLDSNKIELYNHIPYGSPNIYADSNYWGSINTQHIDSIIYDYFDTANYSVVYYQPIIFDRLEMVQGCSQGTITNIPEQNNSLLNSKAFPNPFSNSTEILVNKELKEASFRLYNVFGQLVRSSEHVRGNQIIIRKENLTDGVYLYSIFEDTRKVAMGKIVVE